MVKITKGNKIDVTWTITRYDNGEVTAVALPSDLRLTLYTPNYQETAIADYTVEGNIIRFTFEKEAISLCGVYSLGVSWENEELYARATKKNAFRIVQWTEDSDLENIQEKDIAMQYLNFSTTALWTNGGSGSSDCYTKEEIDAMLDEIRAAGAARVIRLDLEEDGSVMYGILSEASLNDKFIGYNEGGEYMLQVARIGQDYVISYHTDATDEFIHLSGDGEKTESYVEYIIQEQENGD